MYFVDRSKIEQTLEYIDLLLEHIDEASFASTMDKLSLERLAHMLIESILDVGNMMIDGFIMRDPGSYDDIIDILVDEKVIPATDITSYQTVIRLRNDLVRDYLTINHELIIDTLSANKQQLSEFSTYIDTYLKNELGVAHAFSNE